MVLYGVPKLYTFGCRWVGPGSFTCCPTPKERTAAPAAANTRWASMLRFMLLAHTTATRWAAAGGASIDKQCCGVCRSWG